jgi:hypothetical protein
MSQPPKSERQLKEPPVTDPYCVKTVFANDVLSFEAGAGTVVLTFGERRLVPTAKGEQPRMEVVITARIALTGAATDAMMGQLHGLNRAIQHQRDLASAGQPSKPN